MCYVLEERRVTVFHCTAPCSRAVTRVCNTGVISGIRVRGPCSRTQLHTAREHDPLTRQCTKWQPCSRPVNAGSMHQPLHASVYCMRNGHSLLFVILYSFHFVVAVSLAAIMLCLPLSVDFSWKFWEWQIMEHRKVDWTSDGYGWGFVRFSAPVSRR